MPTYEYICEKCEHKFEVFQSISEAPLTVCPEAHCAQRKWGKGRVKRQIGAGAGLIFKGSGFYITDYRSESYKAAAKKDTESKSGSGEATKTAPAKPEAKTTEAKTTATAPTKS